MNRKKAAALYAVYAVALVLILTFGSGVAKFIKGELKEAVLTSEITDVTVGLDISDGLLSASSYRLDCRAVGKFTDGGGLKYSSSNTKVARVNSTGTITTYNGFDGMETVVEITVTSSQDEDFIKVIPITVKKQYPTEFNCGYHVEGRGTNTEQITVGMRVFPYGLPKSGTDYTSNDQEIIYDEEYFAYDEEYFAYDEEKGGYVAIKETSEGEKLSFTILYPDGKSGVTPELSILPYKAAEDFDEIKLLGKGDSLTVKSGGAIIPVIYKNGKAVSSPLEISWNEGAPIKLNDYGRYTTKEASDYTLTVTLPNGFSKSVVISVRNDLTLPKIDIEGVDESKAINVYDGVALRVNYIYENNEAFTDLTLEYDGELIEIVEASRSFVIKPKAMGSCELKLILDDGYDRVEKSYTINVVEDTRESTLISQNITKFVAKVLGHIGLFAILGLLAMNMLRFSFIRSKLNYLIWIISLGLPWAFITELVQIFMDGRTATLSDVAIDMGGYLIGAAVGYFIFKEVAERKAKKAVKEMAAEAMPRE